MPRTARPGRYHHGDLRAALIDATVDLIGENGVRGFSVAEASRRLGVAPSAPYAHFADRDELLAAVAVRAYERFHADLLDELSGVQTPPDRLAAVAYAYVRFAGVRRPLFEVLYGAGLDKGRHPEVEAAERPITRLFRECVGAVAGADGPAGESLAAAVEAAAHGYAMLLLDGSFGAPDEAVEQAAGRAARTTLALVEGRRLLLAP
jgi:AcrR family transcriptional regulator